MQLRVPCHRTCQHGQQSVTPQDLRTGARAAAALLVVAGSKDEAGTVGALKSAYAEVRLRGDGSGSWQLVRLLRLL